MNIIKKKILFVTPYFKPHTGGLENYIANIEKGLRESGWETVVVTSGEVGKPYQEENIEGIKVYRLPTMLKLSNTPLNPLWYFYLRKIIKKERPDIINGHAPVPFLSDMAAIASKDIPFVLTYHAGTMKKGKLLPDILIGLYEKFLLKNTARIAVRIICPSQFVIVSMLQDFKEKALVITPGVDTSLFKPAAGNIQSEKTVLFIARFANMYKMKGLCYLIEAVKQMPQVTLKVIGEPISVDVKNVVFLGPKSVQETAREMQSCTVLVLPSLAHAESFGMVLIEAMACAKPVVGTRIGGIPEVIRDGIDGLVVPAENPKELAVAIGKIITDSTYAELFGKNGFEKIQARYSWKFKIDETNALFEKVLESKNCIGNKLNE